jgi:hypothetical protein
MKYHPLRDGLITSRTLNTVNDRAECLFVRLLLLADDYGTYYADADLVRNYAWPLKSYRTADVERALDDLERASLIVRFTGEDGSRYLEISKYDCPLKHKTRRFPKRPAPGSPALELALVDFDHINRQPLLLKEKEKEKEKEKNNTPPNPQSLDDLPANWSEALKQAWADWAQHRKELKKPITPLARRQQIATIAGWSEERAIANIRHAISSGWTGIYDRQQHNGQRGRSAPAAVEERFARAF